MTWNNVSILTVNTNGVKRNGSHIIEKTLANYHVTCLQETKFRDTHHFNKFQYLLQASFNNKIFTSDLNADQLSTIYPRSGGVTTIIHHDFPGFDSAQEVIEHRIPGRYVVVRIVVGNVNLHIHNVYAPVNPTENSRFYEGLLSRDFCRNAIHWVMGDLNVTLDPLLDSLTATSRHTRTRNYASEWLAQLGVVDGWRIHNPHKRVFTGPPPRKHRLDYCLMSEQFMARYYGSSRYFQVPYSGDHLAHRVTLNQCRLNRGKGLWRVPNKMFDCPMIREAIYNEANILLPEIMNAINPGLVWEGWKRRIRSQLKSLQGVMAQQEDQGLKGSQVQFEKAMREYAEHPTETTKKTYFDAKSLYEDRKEHTARLQQDSSFDFYASKMENSTTPFFKPPTTLLRNVPITMVELESGEISSDSDIVHQKFRSHWGTIFADPDSPSDNTVIGRDKQDLLLDSISNRLDHDSKQTLDATISIEELTETIKRMRGNSAPGPDGFTANFYQVAPDVFAAILCRVFRYQLERGILLPSQRKSSVCLLHKKGKRSDPGNFRPISLMQVDVKILSKALAYRLQQVLPSQVLPSLIHIDQKGFVQGRSLHHQVRLLSDLQHFATKSDSSALALFLDFEKAYDRVNWEYLFRVLEKFGFGTRYISWIRLLYNKPMATLLLNGHLLQPLEVTRGVKQGDPLSSLLFLLSLEPLGNLIRRRRELGVPINDFITITGLYFADDSTLISKDKASIQQQLQLVTIYCQGSGARLNLKKSTLMALNKHNTTPTVGGVRRMESHEIVKYLGIPFGHQVTNEQMLATLTTRFYRGFVVWGRRARTVQGRLLIVRTVILSTLWHFTPHVTIPTSVINQWQQMVNKFILSRKFDTESKFIQLAKSELAYLPRKKGGLQLPHLKTQLYLQRIQILQQITCLLLSPTLEPWPHLAAKIIRKISPVVPIKHPLSLLDISPTRLKFLMDKQSLSEWWLETWKIWHKTKWPLHNHETRMVSSLLESPMWMSKNPVLHVELRNSKTRNLVAVAEPTRSFRLAVARRSSYGTLSDVITTEGNWPTIETFINKNLMVGETPLSRSQQCRRLRKLYNEITQIYHRVLALATNSSDMHASNFVPTVGIQISHKRYWFPYANKTGLKYMHHPQFLAPEKHPIVHDLDGTQTEDIPNYVKFRKTHTGQVLPVLDDLQMRLALRLLPVRSRFWFLQSQIPDIQQCPFESCTAIETTQHRFLQCARSKTLWNLLWKDWKQFFDSSLCWVSLVLPHKLKITTTWKDHSDVLLAMWNIIRCLTLHHIWTERNRLCFEKQPPRPILASINVVCCGFGAHYRRLLRQTDQSTQMKYSQILQRLKRTHTFGEHIRTNPDLYRLRHLQLHFTHRSGVVFHTLV